MLRQIAMNITADNYLVYLDLLSMPAAHSTLRALWPSRTGGPNQRLIILKI
jgi:hypothetical protein